MFTIACCLVVGLVRITVRIRLSVWLVSCYSHVFVLLSVVVAHHRPINKSACHTVRRVHALLSVRCNGTVVSSRLSVDCRFC